MSALDELTNPRNWDYLHKWIGAGEPRFAEAAAELAAKDAVLEAARELVRAKTQANRNRAIDKLAAALEEHDKAA